VTAKVVRCIAQAYTTIARTQKAKKPAAAIVYHDAFDGMQMPVHSIIICA
jgi:hypothetical protein